MKAQYLMRWMISILTLGMMSSAVLASPQGLPSAPERTELLAEHNIASGELEQQTKEIVDNLVAKNYESVRKNFTEAMKKNLSADQIKQVWESVLDRAGAYKSQNDPVAAKVQGYDTVTIRCQMEKGAIAIQAAFDDSGKVDGLWVLPTY